MPEVVKVLDKLPQPKNLEEYKEQVLLTMKHVALKFNKTYTPEITQSAKDGAELTEKLI